VVFPALLVTAACSAEAFAFAAVEGWSDWLTLTAVICGCAAGLALLLRRRHPLGVAIVAVACNLVFTWLFHVIKLPFFDLGSTMLLLIGLYTLAGYGKSTRALYTVGAAALIPVLMPAFWQLQDIARLEHAAEVDRSLAWWAALVENSVVVMVLLPATFTVVLPIMLGRYVTTRHRLIKSLRTQAEQSDRMRMLVTERAEFAREMHGAAKNWVSVMVLQANELQMLADKDPAAVTRTAHRIASIGRQVSDELRCIAQLLRHASGVNADETPQPTLDGMTTLVEDFREMGLPVTVTVEGAPRPIGRVVERAVYRLAEEALTNVYKYAGDAPIELSLRYRPEGLEFVAENAPPRHPPALMLRGGHGLLDLEERVALLNGTFSAGATSAGGFRMAATIPYPASPS
jgi:signal transduction histidine kinase